jgi:hypothetical protein
VAGAAWQCVAACAAVGGGGYTAANVSLVGPNQQALGARFVRAGAGALNLPSGAAAANVAP